MARTRFGRFFPSETWGPRPRWTVPALLAVAAAFTLLDRPLPWVRPATAVAVTALKPVVEGDADAPGMLPSAPMPIEVVYGVPTARTIGLWKTL